MLFIKQSSLERRADVSNASRHGRQHRDAVMSYDKAVQIINFLWNIQETK